MYGSAVACCAVAVVLLVVAAVGGPVGLFSVSTVLICVAVAMIVVEAVRRA